MPTGQPLASCKVCGKSVAHRSELSVRGKCTDCGPRRQREAVYQLIAHDGPFFDHWRARCLAAYESPRIHTPKPIR